MIDDFRGKYRWLSNFHEVDIVFEGKSYPSTEHAFQAAKTYSEKEREDIRRCSTPAQAKKLGRKVDMSPDWESGRRLVVMEVITRKKFQDEELRAKLLATGDQELVEGNTWGDRFWGVCRGKGQNNLGKILMKIRDEIAWDDEYERRQQT